MSTHFRWQVSVTLEADPNGARPVLAGFANQSDAEHWAEMIDDNQEYAEVHVDEIPGQALAPEVQALIDAARRVHRAIMWSRTGDRMDDASKANTLSYALDPFGGITKPSVEELFPVEDWRHEVMNGDTKLGYAEWVQHRAEAESLSPAPVE